MISIITKPTTLAFLKKEAQDVFVSMVKAVVDVEKQIMAVNGELHADEEQLLMSQGSEQKHLWGINLYLDLYGEEDWLEFDSMINLRPSGGNQTRGVDDPEIQAKIRTIVDSLIKS